MGKHRKPRASTSCSTQVMGAAVLTFASVLGRAGRHHVGTRRTTPPGAADPAARVRARWAALRPAVRRELTVVGTALLFPFVGLAAVTGLTALVTTEIAKRGWQRLRARKQDAAAAGERGRPSASRPGRGDAQW
jgi:hypothetical protein